jgi:XTP/dITP diphosphohydrolase
LPPIIKAYRIQDKVKGIGFEFDSAEDAWAKCGRNCRNFIRKLIKIKRNGIG